MPVDLRILRAQLETEKKHLAQQLEQLKETVRPPEERRESTPFGKRDESATETLNLEKRLALEKRLKDQLAEIDHALEKIENGTYGLCDKCGRPIDPARLEALPEASLCMLCKSQPRTR